MHNTIKTRSGRKIILPTPEEEAAINRGIAADPDTYELTAEEFKKLRPYGEVMAERKRMGRPPSASPKVAVSVRYDQDIVDAFRSTGDGWQTRMNDALRVYLSEHPIDAAA